MAFGLLASIATLYVYAITVISIRKLQSVRILALMFWINGMATVLLGAYVLTSVFHYKQPFLPGMSTQTVLLLLATALLQLFA